MGGAPTDNRTKLPTSFQNGADFNFFFILNLILYDFNFILKTNVSFLVYPSSLSEMHNHSVYHPIFDTCYYSRPFMILDHLSGSSSYHVKQIYGKIFACVFFFSLLLWAFLTIIIFCMIKYIKYTENNITDI